MPPNCWHTIPSKWVIDRVDGYDNVIGYEILNEPHLFNASQYDDLGRYHTYMAKGIREISDKKIFFDRETTRDFQRLPSLEYKIVPQNVSGLVYTPHLYAAPYPGSQAGNQAVADFPAGAGNQDDWRTHAPFILGCWTR